MPISRIQLQLASQMLLGRGAIDLLGERADALELRRPFVLMDPNVSRTQFGERAILSLSTRPLTLWTDIETNPPVKSVHAALDAFRAANGDGIIAIGGGSTIDVAKAVGVLATNGGQMQDYWRGKPIAKPLPGLVAVPTTCGTGSEISPYAVISDPTVKRKYGIQSPHLIPREIILDADALESLPSHFVAATAFDALAHALETHASRLASELTRTNTFGTIRRISRHLRPAFQARERRSLECLMAAAANARMLYPRTGLTLAHALSHPLGIHLGMHHGEAVALTTLPSIRYNFEYSMEAYTEIAEAIAGHEIQTSEALSFLESWFGRLFEDAGIGLPCTNKIEDPARTLEAIASDSLTSSNIPSNPRTPSKEAILEMLAEILTQSQ